MTSIDAERLPEDAGLMSATWVRGIQAIFLDLLKIEDGPFAMRQARHT
jgi:hypothetical protein